MKQRLAAIANRLGGALCAWAYEVERANSRPCEDCGCPIFADEDCEVCAAKFDRDRMADSAYDGGYADGFTEAQDMYREPAA